MAKRKMQNLNGTVIEDKQHTTKTSLIKEKDEPAYKKTIIINTPLKTFPIQTD